MFRNILVHVKSYEKWSAHIDTAIELAKRTGARLTGLLALQEIAIAKQLHGGLGGGGEFLPALQKVMEEKAGALKARFESALAAAGVEGGLDVCEGRANELLSLAARFQDLIVVEQTDTLHDEINWVSAEDAALFSGRPTLIVPLTGAPVDFGRCILFAWNASREAVRALHSGMPFIERTEHVVVLEGPAREVAASITKPPSLDLEAFLKTRAGSVEFAGRSVRDADAAETILATAKTHKCDLIIMGAYGRHGVARWILGGATRDILREADIPVFAAH